MKWRRVPAVHNASAYSTPGKSLTLNQPRGQYHRTGRLAANGPLVVDVNHCASVFVDASCGRFCVRTVSHTPVKPRRTASLSDKRGCTSL